MPHTIPQRADTAPFKVTTASDFPWLAKANNGSSLSNNMASAPYRLASFDIPRVAIHFDHYLHRPSMRRLRRNPASPGNG